MRFSAAASIALIAALALAACGGSGPAPEAPAEPAASTTPATTAAPATPAVAPGEPSPEFANLPAPYNTANYAVGARTWKLCQSCHLTQEGAGNLVGPNLHGIFGRQVAAAPDFAYSPALAAESFIWTPEQLDHWLQNPRTFVPGNRMSFAGVRKESDRLGVIAYLMIETGYQPETAPAEETAPE
ncbi:cytochrome c family protein [Hyphomonas sp. WL0036]|uniref:c-type cytochrome n=1 Tax=Hyphomonas sediminis TaxID=2866160 RepID=UPI001C810C67|nr:cytochrome c family protein [Hyphomonas sediminis]MBY9068358.1 cytochrome c family protein [Hyphomonas sediminis]